MYKYHLCELCAVVFRRFFLKNFTPTWILCEEECQDSSNILLRGFQADVRLPWIPQNKHSPSFKQRNEEMMGSCNFGQSIIVSKHSSSKGMKKMIRSSQWVTIVRVPMNSRVTIPQRSTSNIKKNSLTRASTRTSSHQPSEDPDLVVLWFGF